MDPDASSAVAIQYLSHDLCPQHCFIATTSRTEVAGAIAGPDHFRCLHVLVELGSDPLHIETLKIHGVILTYLPTHPAPGSGIPWPFGCMPVIAPDDAPREF